MLERRSSRALRGSSMRLSVMEIGDFFQNTDIPSVGDVLLKRAVEHTLEWKDYTETTENHALLFNSGGTTAKEVFYAHETNSPDSSVEEDSDAPLEQLKLAQTPEFPNKCFEGTHKYYVLEGLGQDSLQNLKWKWVLPHGAGLEALNNVNDFLLPWDLFQPRKSDIEWQPFNKNEWLVNNYYESGLSKAIPDWANMNRECIRERHGCDDNKCQWFKNKVECNDDICRTSICENRKFEEYAKARKETSTFFSNEFCVLTTVQKGNALFSNRSFEPGQLVIEYTGEVVLRRAIMKSKSEMFEYIDDKLVIDASKKGSLARFINHSCEPNCVLERWFVNNVPRLGVFAIKNILPGDEITYYYHSMVSRSQCYCGSDRCCGTIGNAVESESSDFSLSDNDLLSESDYEEFNYTDSSSDSLSSETPLVAELQRERKGVYIPKIMGEDIVALSEAQKDVDRHGGNFFTDGLDIEENPSATPDGIRFDYYKNEITAQEDYDTLDPPKNRVNLKEKYKDACLADEIHRLENVLDSKRKKK